MFCCVVAVVGACATTSPKGWIDVQLTQRIIGVLTQCCDAKYITGLCKVLSHLTQSEVKFVCVSYLQWVSACEEI